MTAVPYPEPGTRFGYQVVLGPAPTRSQGREVFIRCDCGSERPVVARHLRRGKSTQCVRCAHKGLQKHHQVGLLTSLMWNQILFGAKSRNIQVKITQEDAWAVWEAQEGCCAISGLPLEIAQVASRRTETTASLDRIDAAQGYVRGNIQWTHKNINRMKGDLPEDEFLRLCKIIVDYRSL